MPRLREIISINKSLILDWTEEGEKELLEKNEACNRGPSSLGPAEGILPAVHPISCQKRYATRS